MLPTLRNNLIAATAYGAPSNRLNALMDGVFGADDRGSLGQSRAATAMPMAMWEDDDQVHVEMDLPGVAEADLDVTVHNDTLTIRAERKPEAGRRYLFDGRAVGRFERAIMLPEAVVADEAQAELRDGVLRLALPKSPASKPRKIALRSS